LATAEKVKGMGVAVLGFLFGNAFCLSYSCFDFGPLGFDSLAGQEWGASSCLLQDAHADFGICW